MKRAFIFLYICSLTQVLSAIQWPVENPVPLETFGTPRPGRAEVGLVLDKGDSPVKPYNKGELIFIAGNGYGTRGDGGVVVIHHDDGFRSCYGGLSPSINLENRSYLNEEDTLGVVSDRLLFSIRDFNQNRWVNPLFMFTSMEDREKPVIEGIFLVNDSGTLELSDSGTVPPGSYKLLLDTADLMAPDGVRLMPYRVKVRYLGMVVFSLSLDSIESRNGSYSVGGGEGIVMSSFTDDGLIDCGFISVNPGKGFLEVEVSDYRGNRTIKNISLNQGQQ